MPLNAIGETIQRTVHDAGFTICDGPMDHGIGRRAHEPPDMPNVSEPALHQPLTDGLVIIVGPLVAAGGPTVHMAPDGWTVRTADASLSARVMHTILGRRGAPLVLTV